MAIVLEPTAAAMSTCFCLDVPDGGVARFDIDLANGEWGWEAQLPLRASGKTPDQALANLREVAKRFLAETEDGLTLGPVLAQLQPVEVVRRADPDDSVPG